MTIGQQLSFKRGVKVCPGCQSNLICERTEKEWFCESCGLTFTTPDENCGECGSVELGQTGEYPCVSCGRPRTWDDGQDDLWEKMRLICYQELLECGHPKDCLVEREITNIEKNEGPLNDTEYCSACASTTRTEGKK